ncbi:MAG: prolipoprotein diacylglyceryl transferase [Cytophagales bacterium]|nr:prolipoprotein diacylglyceryl transferase [Cytophagales bacterium]
MQALLNYILWYPTPEIIPGFRVRWYGLLFAMGFIFGQIILDKIFKAENKPQRDVETFVIIAVIFTVIGARLGHVFFYEAEKYLANPIDIIKIWEGGLASHGAAVALIIGVWVYINYYIKISFSGIKIKKITREGQTYFWVIDRLVITVALAGALIRTGNFMNSEIIGKPTNSDYGVVFAHDPQRYFEQNNANIEDIEFEKGEGRQALAAHHAEPVDMIITFKKRRFSKEQAEEYAKFQLAYGLQKVGYVRKHILIPSDQKLNYSVTQDRGVTTLRAQVWGVARYPAQLYEALSCLLLFFVLFGIWSKYKEKTPKGLLFGIFLVVVFSLRFVYEFFKENQVAFEDKLEYNMGQYLSIPLVTVGIIVIIVTLLKSRKK